MRPRRILEKVLASQANVRFTDMCKLVEAFSFRLSRVKGSHHIFVHSLVPELVNLQEVQGKDQAVPGSAISQAGGRV